MQPGVCRTTSLSWESTATGSLPHRVYASATCSSPQRRPFRNALPCCGPGIDYPHQPPGIPDQNSAASPVYEAEAPAPLASISTSWQSSLRPQSWVGALTMHAGWRNLSAPLRGSATQQQTNCWLNCSLFTNEDISKESRLGTFLKSFDTGRP